MNVYKRSYPLILRYLYTETIKRRGEICININTLNTSKPLIQFAFFNLFNVDSKAVMVIPNIGSNRFIYTTDPLLLPTILAFRERIMNWWIFAISSFSFFLLTSGGEKGKQ